MKFMYFFDCKLKRFTMYGKKMLHPAKTGVYQDGISCIKEDDVNLWFYTKNGVTIAVDAGHLVFKGIEKEFEKIGIDPLKIKTVLLTHSDVDHVGGVDRICKNYLYPNAQVYIGKGEENYFDVFFFFFFKMGIPLMNPARLQDKITGSGVKVVCTCHSGIRTDMSKLFAHYEQIDSSSAIQKAINSLNEPNRAAQGCTGEYGISSFVFEEKQKQEYLEYNPDVKEDWDEEFGDRVNQLVIIGKGYDKKAIEAELKKCLDEKAIA